MSVDDKTLELLHEIRDRVVKVEESIKVFNTAFPKNDLGSPDFDGHRRDHVVRMEEAKSMQEYKIEVTKKVLVAAIFALLALVGVGFVNIMGEKVQAQQSQTNSQPVPKER